MKTIILNCKPALLSLDYECKVTDLAVMKQMTFIIPAPDLSHRFFLKKRATVVAPC
jgi:hypothetical protein